jgi:predicted metal-binding protein
MEVMPGDDKRLSDETRVLGKIKFLVTFLFLDTKEALFISTCRICGGPSCCYSNFAW